MFWKKYFSDGFYRQVNQISGAHNTLDKQTPSKPKKKQNSKGLAPSVVRFYSCVHVCRSWQHHRVSFGEFVGHKMRVIQLVNESLYFLLISVVYCLILIQYLQSWFSNSRVQRSHLGNTLKIQFPETHR